MFHNSSSDRSRPWVVHARIQLRWERCAFESEAEAVATAEALAHDYQLTSDLVHVERRRDLAH